jgi:hypothetical protein
MRLLDARDAPSDLGRSDKGASKFKTIYELDKEDSVFSFYDTRNLPIRNSIASHTSRSHSS